MGYCNQPYLSLPYLSDTNILSFLSLQENAIENLILTMSIEDGYNFDWDTINQRNYAIGEWPRAEIYSTIEENLENINNNITSDYTNVVDYEIHVAGKINFSSVNPLFDIINIHNLALDDLKMLFGNNINITLNNTCDSILYKGFVREIKSVDQFIPTKLITKWRVSYSKDRRYFLTYSGS